MKTYLIAYFASAAFFLVVDMLWLGFLMAGFYKTQMGGLLLAQPNWTAAVLFYALYMVGLVYFGILPGLETKDFQRVLINSALFGLFAYATYDLTNLATLRGWSLALACVDMAWGTFLSAAAGSFGYYVTQLMQGKAS